MLKKIVAFMLCVVLLAAAMPMTVSANPQQGEQIKNQITKDYYRAVAGSGREDLHGYCGLMTSWQLYLLGINQYLVINDGNGQFDYYHNREETTGGHHIRSYPASAYTFEEAMYAVCDGGRRDAYNILVGFQWTNTEAGATYGHAVVVYAILDGIVYFTEGFATSLGTAPGRGAAVPLDTFIDYYDDWTVFDGIILFGREDYTDSCAQLPCNMYAEVVEDVSLYSCPCTPDEPDAECELIRTIDAGERLLVTGLYQNPAGIYYYRVQDEAGVAFADAAALEPLVFNYHDVKVSDFKLPNKLQNGKRFDVKGTVRSDYGTMESVYMDVYSQQGTHLINQVHTFVSGSFPLDTEKVRISGLEEQEYYSFELYADVSHYYCEDGSLRLERERICLADRDVYEKESAENAQRTIATADNKPQTGWYCENGTWYYVENGQPYSGWICYKGVDYYLKEDGSVTTGWAEINGQKRYFSATGAMRTGWLETEEGRRYLLSNGAMAIGWKRVDREDCYFDADGILHTEGWITVDDAKYYLYEDGSTATGWVDLPEGRFCFDENGKFLAQIVQDKDKTKHIVAELITEGVTAGNGSSDTVIRNNNG